MFDSEKKCMNKTDDIAKKNGSVKWKVFELRTQQQHHYLVKLQNG